jgi:tryptophan halogenase
LRPSGYDPRADATPNEVLVANAAALRSEVQTAARNTPDHAAYIKQIGAASDSAPLVANPV